MSHFTVVVVVPNSAERDPADALATLDDLLDPFDENKEMPGYTVWLDEEEVGRAVAWYREHPEYVGEDKGGPTKTFEEFVGQGDLEAMDEWTRQAVGSHEGGDPDRGVYDAEGHRFGYVSHYNPDSQWDWWALGGRWHGFWQLKPGVKVGAEGLPTYRLALGPVGDDRIEGAQKFGPITDETQAILGNSGVFGDDPSENFEGRADLARIRDIDFEGARALAAHSAEVAYDKFEAVTAGLAIPPTWDETRKLAFVEAGIDPEPNYVDPVSPEEAARRDEAMKHARETFASYPWVKALNENDLSNFFMDYHDYWKVYDGGREAFINSAVLQVDVPYAVVISDEEGPHWVAKGKMGWFGMASNEQEGDAWAKQYRKLIESLPDDTFLAVVDCHI